jgi:hypothetical protein
MRTTWILACVVSLAVTTASCCFSETHTVTTTTTSEPSLPPVDPSIDAVWLCANESVVDDRCPAHTPSLPSTTFSVGMTFRTHDLPRFAESGSIVLYAGEGATRLDIGSVPLGASSGRVPPPGEILTWTVYEELIAPVAGWPVEAPVHVEITDARGLVAAAATVTFTGPRTPTRPLGVLAVCRSDQLDESHRYCPTPSTTVARDPTQAVWVSYASSDPAVWAPGVEIVLERQAGTRWRHENTERLDALVLAPEHVESVHLDYTMDQPAFASGNVLRVTLRSGSTEVAQTMFTME